jgi:hypothetical protein
MIVCIESLYQQHTKRCNWEMFEGHKEFFDQVRRKGDKLDNFTTKVHKFTSKFIATQVRSDISS